jgi:hypothetical protein
MKLIARCARHKVALIAHSLDAIRVTTMKLQAGEYNLNLATFYCPSDPNGDCHLAHLFILED